MLWTMPYELRPSGRFANKSSPTRVRAEKRMAEREGFEPPEPLRAHLISSQAHSTTLPPLRGGHLAAESRPKCRLSGGRSRGMLPSLDIGVPGTQIDRFLAVRKFVAS